MRRGLRAVFKRESERCEFPEDCSFLVLFQASRQEYRAFTLEGGNREQSTNEWAAKGTRLAILMAGKGTHIREGRDKVLRLRPQ